MVHAVNKDYPGMAGDFIKLGFLAKGGAPPAFFFTVNFYNNI